MKCNTKKCNSHTCDARDAGLPFTLLIACFQLLLIFLSLSIEKREYFFYFQLCDLGSLKYNIN